MKSLLLLLLFLCTLALVYCNNRPVQKHPPQVADRGVYYSYPWLQHYEPILKVINQITTPVGTTRANFTQGSFQHYLQQLPLKHNNEVRWYDGTLKPNQNAQYRVINIDIGSQNLQQCADACMRLRAEYLYSQKRYAEISFNFSNGFKASYSRWAAGERILVKDNSCHWIVKGEADYSYANFRKYLDIVFMYAGTSSLTRELIAIDINQLQPGDLFIKGGYPGHAVMVMDVCLDTKGKKYFTLAQSYMPAQDIHILKNPADVEGGPWYTLDGERLQTPEWNFEWEELMRWADKP